jgi:hypothetical protein
MITAVVLVFLACTVVPEGTQKNCDEVELLFDGSKMQCELFGQMAMADWERLHPTRRHASGYRCDTSGRSEA